MAFKTRIPVRGSMSFVEVVPEDYAKHQHVVAQVRHPRHRRHYADIPDSYVKSELAHQLADHVAKRNEVQTHHDVLRMEDLHVMDTYVFTKAEFREAIIKCTQDVLSQIDFNAEQLVKDVRAKIAEEVRLG